MLSYVSVDPFYNPHHANSWFHIPRKLDHELALAASVDGPSRLSTHMKTNWIRYAYTKRNWVRRLRWERATVCIAPLRIVESVESGSKTYFNERSCSSSLVTERIVICGGVDLNSPRRRHWPRKCTRRRSNQPSHRFRVQVSGSQTQPGWQ
jgi:hypothetical protein